jgi:hypothetical protein
VCTFCREHPNVCEVKGVASVLQTADILCLLDDRGLVCGENGSPFTRHQAGGADKCPLVVAGVRVDMSRSAVPAVTLAVSQDYVGLAANV